MFQAGARYEGVFPNAGDDVGDRDSIQAAAKTEAENMAESSSVPAKDAQAEATAS